MPHGHHTYAKEYDIVKAKMYVYSQSDHALLHWKYVLRCCAKFPIINLHDQETDDQYPGTSPSIRFHIYHIIALCIKQCSLTLTDKKVFASVNRILLQEN